MMGGLAALELNVALITCMVTNKTHANKHLTSPSETPVPTKGAVRARNEGSPAPLVEDRAV